MTKKRLTRRSFVRHTASVPALGWVGAAGIPGFSIASGQEESPHRFLQIFLSGGWDSALATDPVLNWTDTYDPAYKVGTDLGGGVSYQIHTVPGKENLKVGPGLAPSLTAFRDVPTTFVNGLFVEVTAHKLAVDYGLTGINTLLRSANLPAFIAKIAAAAGGFPSHVVMGTPIPLGDTIMTSPPVQAATAEILANMLSGPYGNDVSDTAVDRGMDLLARLDDSYSEHLEEGLKASHAGWKSSQVGLPDLYKANYGTSLTLDDATKARYGVSADLTSANAKVAASFLALKSGLTTFVTTTLDGFDTHADHFSLHVPTLGNAASLINTIVADLSATQDPLASGKSLMDNTTILVNSEFVRTPKLNLGSGTDHWQSGSCILMGRGVKDNQVVGATDDAAKATGWKNGQSVPADDDTFIKPENLAAAILRFFGLTSDAAAISKEPLDELFS